MYPGKGDVNQGEVQPCERVAASILRSTNGDWDQNPHLSSRSVCTHFPGLAGRGFGGSISIFDRDRKAEIEIKIAIVGYFPPRLENLFAFHIKHALSGHNGVRGYGMLK